MAAYAEAMRSLAIERSNQDAHQSNENLRAASQAAILINGGAATAVLAFVSALIGKDKFDVSLAKAAGFAIMFYALGVGCAPLAVWFANRALRIWNVSWKEVIREPSNHDAGTREHIEAQWWNFLANYSLGMSILVFMIGSFILSWGFIKAPSFTAKVVNDQVKSQSAQTPGAPKSQPAAVPHASIKQ